jgi:hypothetical protein
MVAVFFDLEINDARRRAGIFAGELYVYSPRPAMAALCAHARALIEDAFHPHDPRRIHEVLPVEGCAAALADLKPRFIHHSRSRELLRQVLLEFGCDGERTYFDLPRLRSAMPRDYLTSGIAYAFHPHRDTWYSAPFCQLNWWGPVFDLAPGNAMAFHPRYWQEPVRNSSSGYDYARWVRESRSTAAQHIRRDTRIQPRPQEPLELEPDLRVITEPGGVLLFSAAQLHSTVPNDTGICRYSIDFRTVSLDDLEDGRGAPNRDAACSGTSLIDFIRLGDFAPMPPQVAALHAARPAQATAEPALAK